MTSDLAGWATDTHGFFVGGYNADYVAQDRVWSIEVATYSETGELGIADHSPLLDGRGDVSASVNLETGYAYVSGGFTHENDFCEPLDSVERYSISGDTWLEVARLPTARADKVMVTFEGRTISMGGERQIEEKCELEKITPGELSMAVDDIEVLNDDDSSWQQLEPLPEHRFRFAAVVFEDTIYTFGGQEAYDETCNCLKTTNEVVAYEVVNPEHTHDQGGEGEHLPLGSEDVATADSSNEASQAVALKSILVPSLFIMAVSAYFLC